MTLSFAIEGRLADCVQLTYRTPVESVRGLLPEGLELVQRGPWAFWSVSCARVERARPAGVPAFCGLSYTQVAYRLLVQAMTDRAEVVRGLYFVRSDVSARTVSLLGHRLSDFRMCPASIAMQGSDCGVGFEVSQTPYARADAVVEATHAPAHLAPESCFPTTADARAFCRFIPDALTTRLGDGRRMLRLTRVDHGPMAVCETPLAVHRAELAYFETLGQAGHIGLEWASRLSPVRVRVEAGRCETLLVNPVKGRAALGIAV